MLVALPGCSRGDEPSADVPAAVVDAPRRTIAAGSARVAAWVESDAGAPNLGIEMDGVYDFGRQRGRFFFEIDGRGVSGLTEGIVDRSTLYLDIGEGVIPAKRWVRIGLGAPATDGVAATGVPSLQANPTTSLRYLAGAEDVTEAGKEIVRQIRTTRYRMRVDVERAARAEADAVGSALGEIGTLRLDAEAWIDDQGRLRRFEFTIPLNRLPGAPDSAAGTFKVRQELFEFGAEADMETPPPEQVGDLSEIPAPRR